MRFGILVSRAFVWEVYSRPLSDVNPDVASTMKKKKGVR